MVSNETAINKHRLIFRSISCAARLPLHLRHRLTSGMVLLLDISRQTGNLTWTSCFCFPVPLFARYPLKAREESGVYYIHSPLGNRNEKRKPPFVSLLRPFELPMVEHKGRKRVCAFLPSVATFEVSNVSEGDCFAALLKSSCHSALATAASSKPSYQCGDRGGRCPPMTVSLSYGFFLSFTVSRFEI